MPKTFAARAALAAAPLLVLLAGCTRSTDFTLSRTFDHVAPAPGTAYAFTDHVDIPEQAPGAWKRRDHIDSVTVTGLEVTVTAVHSGGPSAASGRITLSHGADAVTMDWAALIPTGAPHTIDVPLDPAASRLVNDALKSDGVLGTGFAASLAAGQPAIDLAARVDLHVSMKFKIP